MKIQVLPKEVFEKIAAGEVIERPFSVVKELVENSLDAGATSITIELENGGMKLIRITDNGAGIAEADLPTALERHATSKIFQIEDIWNLSTLGFRGEALPSITAISHFTIESRQKDEKGRVLFYEGGTQKRDDVLPANSLCPRPSGTRISVEHLFFNLPARLKFLKTKSSETSAVRDLLERIAFCRPEVGFHLISEGRKTLNLPAVTNQAKRVCQILDIPEKNLVTVNQKYADIQVDACIDIDSRAQNSKQIYLSVNGRMMKDRFLQQAVLVGLRPVMMEGEYPRIYLNLQVQPDQVDVNVHPTKTEVRFAKSNDIFQIIGMALSKVSREDRRIARNVSLPLSEATPSAPSSLFAPNFSSGFNAAPTEERHFLPAQDEMESIFSTPEPQTPSSERFSMKSFGFPSTLKYLGQIKNTYLLFEEKDGLVIVDQHAAHERINYEKIKSRFLDKGLAPQPLLMGCTLKFKADELALIFDHEDFFKKFGFEYEIFGDEHIVIRSAPEQVKDNQVIDLFKALLSEVKDQDFSLENLDPTQLSAKLERTLSTAACHASIRAGQSLSVSESIALIQEMEHTPSSLNCPHGRPASIRLEFDQIENLFKRT